MTTMTPAATTPRDLVRRVAKAAGNAPPRTVAAATRLLDVAAERNELDHFFAHALNALIHMARTNDIQSLAAVDSASDALLAILDRPDLLQEIAPRDPLAGARLRGLQLKRELLAAEGGVVSAQVLAEALGISRQAVDKRRKRGALIGIDLGKRGYAYPVWQIGLEGLDAVLATLQGLDPWTQNAFMLAQNRWLEGERPLDVLRHGEPERVMEAARMYGEQVAA